MPQLSLQLSDPGDPFFLQGTGRKTASLRCEMLIGILLDIFFYVCFSVTLAIRESLVLYFTFSDAVHKNITVFMGFN